MNVLEFARQYDKIICKNPYIPILYYVAKPYETSKMVEQILCNSKYDVDLKTTERAKMLKIKEISDNYYPMKCSSLIKGTAKFKQLIKEQMDYGYFYGVVYNETTMYITLVPTDKELMSEYKLDWGKSNHRNSNDLNLDINKSQLYYLFTDFKGIKISHEKESNEPITLY